MNGAAHDRPQRLTEAGATAAVSDSPTEEAAPLLPRVRAMNCFSGRLQIFNIAVNEWVPTSKFFACVCIHNEPDFVP